MLNIDWFQPFKHRSYSIDIMYLAIMNLPRTLRFKRESIILVGLIPGSQEPSLTINSYLTPLVSDLLVLWNGLNFDTHDYSTQTIRCALLCVGCDLPAGRKVCGFLSYTANLGCSRCYHAFGTGVFGQLDSTVMNGYIDPTKNTGKMCRPFLAAQPSPNDHKRNQSSDAGIPAYYSYRILILLE